jgi:hypothetical protein
VWPRDVAATHRVTGNVRAGTIYINMPNPVDAAAPWGGYGSSGWGREMGSGAIDLYTEVKSVWTSLARLAPTASTGAPFPDSFTERRRHSPEGPSLILAVVPAFPIFLQWPRIRSASQFRVALDSGRRAV